MKLKCPLCKNKLYYTEEGLKTHLTRFHQRVDADSVSKQCVHYWIIDIENKGICKYCGAVKQFPLQYDIGYPYGRNIIIKDKYR